MFDQQTNTLLYYGGGEQGGTVHNEMWAYDTQLKKWERKGRNGNPPPLENGSGDNHPSVTCLPTGGTCYYHQTTGAGAPQDFSYNTVTDAWSQMTSVGTGEANVYGSYMAYVPSSNSLVTYANSSGGIPSIWIGSLGSGSGSPDNTAPSVPSNITAVASSTSVSLSWTASTDPDDAVSYYTIYRNGSSVGSPGTNSFNDTGLSPSTTYNYTISATDSHNNISGQSATKSVTTTAGSSDATAPSVPQSLSASAVSSSGINLSWTASTDNVGVTGYKIYRANTQIGTSATNSYSDSGLTASTAYSYTVSAYDAAGNNSAQSASASATTLALGSGSAIAPLTIQEALYPGDMTGSTYNGGGGITRTQDPLSVGIPLADSAGISSVSQLGLSGTSMGQFRVLGRWPSGNIKWVQVDTEADVAAGGTNTSVALTSGSGNFGGGNLATDNGATISVNTGAGQFTIKKANFNVVDTAVVNGTTVVAAGASQGLVMMVPNPTAAYPANVTCGTGSGQSPCTTAYSSANDPNSTCVIEENGPVKAVIKCTGTHMDTASHPYMHYTVREYFYKNQTGAKLATVLRNADYGTSNTFATAYKGFKSYELRLGANLTGPLNYSIASYLGDNSTGCANGICTGTLSGSDNAYIYQGLSNYIPSADSQGNNCGLGCYDTFTTDQGGVLQKNGTTISTSNVNQAPMGFADVSNSSGVGVEIGVEQMSARWPKSLEFDNGGSDVRIGIFPSENGNPSGGPGNGSFAVYQPWPQWEIETLFVNFHATAPASPKNDFLKFQHPLLARADVAYYNAANVFRVPLPTAAEEDAFYVGAQSAVAQANGYPQLNEYCTNGATSNCFRDRQTLGASVSPPIYMSRDYTWHSGGSGNQAEYRWGDLLNFIKRGQGGRFLNSKYFYLYQQSTVSWPHCDGTSVTDAIVNDCTWRSHPNVLDGYGRPYYGYVASANSTLGMTDWFETLHFHWYGQPDYYFMTGDETIKEAMDPLKDWYMNSNTYQNGMSGSGADGIGIARGIGVEMMSAGIFSDYLNAIGDSASAATVLAQGQTNFTKYALPDPCFSNLPAGCTMPPQVATDANQVDPQGVNLYRGIIGSSSGRGSGTKAFCYVDIPGPGVRALSPFQGAIFIDGLLTLRKSSGSGWNNYTRAGDLAYGVSLWGLGKEGFNEILFLRLPGLGSTKTILPPLLRAFSSGCMQSPKAIS